MRIFLTNDDGIEAVGINELAKALKAAGHELFIGAPANNMSCVSHGLTLRDPIIVEKRSLPGLEGIPAYAVYGTPADCVRLCTDALGADPEIIVSGINHAPNLGSDAVYSGTVAAAVEGYMIDLPAFAVSKDTFELDHMEDAAVWFAEKLPELMKFFDKGVGMLNVNLPSVPKEAYKGVRAARAGLQRYRLKYTRELRQDGREAFRVSSTKISECGEYDDTDERAVLDGFICITPLTYDTTDHSRLEEAKTSFSENY